MDNFNKQVRDNLQDYYSAHIAEERKMDNTVLRAFLVVMGIFWPVACILAIWS